MSVPLIIIVILCAGVIFWQLLVWFFEIRLKNKQCQSAVEKSRQLKKMMLVAGGPWGGHSLRRKFNLPAHREGDVSIDIRPSAIMDWPNGVVANVTNLPFPDKTFGTALASHLLEHLPDTQSAKLALAELIRVADNVYIAYPSRQSVAAWIIPDHHVWIWQKDGFVYLKQRGKHSGTDREIQFKL